MLIESFKDYLRQERAYSERTVTEYETDLNQFQSFFRSEDELLEWKVIDADVIRRWIVRLMDDGYASTSVNRKLSSLRSFYKFLMRKGEVRVNPMTRVLGPKNAKPFQ